MEKDRREKLLNIIQKDDKAAFGEFMRPEVLSAVFGRFPLLSLLYLFNAKRIVKRYLSELITERPRLKEEAFSVADKLFAKKAGKCLRYYLTSEVSPLEMLAILGKGKQLEKLYPRYPNASRALPMIHNIYFTRLGEGVTVLGDKLILPKEPLSFNSKRWLVRFAFSFVFVAALIAAVTSAVFVYFGAGTSGNYYRARSAEDTLSALQSDSYIKLENHVTMSSSVAEYSAALDGGSHIVHLTSPFVEKLTGEIRDVIFVLDEGFVGDAVILENLGVLNNVRVVAEGTSLSKGGEFMGLLTAHNEGTIEFCTAVINVTIEGEGGGDCFFAPFAGKNEGTIHDCTTDGVVKGKNVDVAGVAGKNASKGVITDCVVKGDLFELSDIKNWTPNVAGVAAQNDGTIYRSVTTGKVTSTLQAPSLEDSDSAASAYAAGIACVNGGSIKECESGCVVYSSAENGYAFAAGVATVNTHHESETSVLPGTVEGSKVNGNVLAFSSTHDAYAGGIAAVNYYRIGSSRCISSVTAEAANGYAFAGGIVCRNAYTDDSREYYIGEVESCLCSGNVTATSSSSNVYVGGIAAENNQGKISACGATSVLTAETTGETSEAYLGGIVSYNYGTVEKCFFTGTLPSYDENTLVGGICGVIRLSYTLRINMRDNYFAAGTHTSGSTVLEINYYNLRAGTIYSLDYFEKNESYTPYIEAILDLGGSAATEAEIKTKEGIYYE